MAFSTVTYIKSGNLSSDEFRAAIESIDTATSVTGILYSQIKVTGDTIVGVRDTTKAPFRISLSKLYSAYTNENIFSTSSLKPYVDRVQSPSLAILKEIGAIEGSSASGKESTQQSNVKKSCNVDVECKADSTIQNTKKEKSINNFVKLLISIGIFVICYCIYANSGDPTYVENGKLTDAAKAEAVYMIKQQLSDPSSFNGSGFIQGVYDSNSYTERYFMLYKFSIDGGAGLRIEKSAHILFDAEGKVTSIKILD